VCVVLAEQTGRLTLLLRNASDKAFLNASSVNSSELPGLMSMIRLNMSVQHWSSVR